jgi:pectinesterase
MNERLSLAAIVVCTLLPAFAAGVNEPGAWSKSDMVVAPSGGDFTSIQKALASIPKDNRQRLVVLVKDGVYREKVRVDASFVTLRGESRKGTRIEFAQLNTDYLRNPDGLGQAVININGNDFVLENLTVENAAGVIGPHAMTLYGKGDRTVVADCDVLSHGADTVSLWLGGSGRYYHTRCNFRGSVDFVCPRGWCYISDSNFYEMKATAAVWHDGSQDKDMKFVLRHCTFAGAAGWSLARHHHDAQFYFLDCTFARTMIDRSPYRVIYPLEGGEPNEADVRRNQDLDKTNIWGERAYFHNCHREGGDYTWMADNLPTAVGSPGPATVTPSWTFAGQWDPERASGPTIRKVSAAEGNLAITFSENVTVKGKPRVKLTDGACADYVSGSGSETLLFASPGSAGKPSAIEVTDAAILATQAAGRLLPAQLSLP